GATDQPSVVLVVSDADSRVVGFASGGAPRDGDPVYAGELDAIYLLRQAQGQGVGRRLVAAVTRTLAERGIDSLLLWVFAENPARRFYEALGGKLVGQQQFELGGRMMAEVSYGWRDTTPLYTRDGDRGDGGDGDGDPCACPTDGARRPGSRHGVVRAAGLPDDTRVDHPSLRAGARLAHRDSPGRRGHPECRRADRWLDPPRRPCRPGGR